MITFDLKCSTGDHRFEGWFASSSEFDRQKQLGLIACPFCGSADVGKAVMAPSIGRKGNQSSLLARNQEAPQEAAVAISNLPEMPVEIQSAIAEVAKMQTKMLEKSEWVGRQFADEARAIHYGESEARSIHGEASLNEARELHEEGVSVAPLPLPFVPPQAKN
jgi:hypothetical protein